MTSSDSRTETRAGTRTGTLATELALVAVTAALAITSVRLFRDISFLGRALLVVLAAHGCAFALRRLRVGAGAATIALVVLGAIVISWIHLWSTTHLGLPTGGTLDAARLGIRSAFSGFRQSVAPVPTRLGFDLALAITIWIVATFADTAAFRGDAPLHAVLPHIGVFIASCVFALGAGAVWSTALIVAAICVHLGAQRANRLGGRPWIQSEGRRGTAALLAGVGAITAAAAILGSLAGPALPGASSDGLVDLRAIGKGPGPVEVGNPLVGVSNLLGPQSDNIAFTVRSAAPHYWRLTALEQYDATDGQWTTRRSYREVSSGTPLPPNQDGPGEKVALTVAIVDLPGIWMPTAFRPELINAPVDIRYDADTASVIPAGRPTVPRITYDVVSRVPTLPHGGTDPITPDAAELPNTYREIPPLSRDAVRWLDSLRSRAGNGSADPFQLALAMQRQFRENFVYDPTVDYSRSSDPIGSFLVAQAGFCQQFASTFAVFARALGIPSRVAVGFSWGDPDDSVDNSGRRSYIVRGRHAHAWPELYLNGVGWVAFEPTPSRGNPDSVGYTSISPAQAAPGDPTTADQVTTTTAVGSPRTPTTAAANPRLRPEVSDPTTPDDAGAREGGPLWVPAAWVLATGLLVAIVSVLARLAWVAFRRRRRTDRAVEPPDLAELAWVEACEWLDELGLDRFAWETPAEFSDRVVGATGWTSVATLARIETTRRYGATLIAEEDAISATVLAAEIADRSAEQLDGRARFLHQLGWKRRN